MVWQLRLLSMRHTLQNSSTLPSRLLLWSMLVISSQENQDILVICNNCAIHKNIQFLRMVRERGGLVHFLPPYSPDFMPVEQAFFFMKAWLKRNRDVADRHPIASVYDALEDITQEHAGYFFQACEY